MKPEDDLEISGSDLQKIANLKKSDWIKFRNSDLIISNRIKNGENFNFILLLHHLIQFFVENCDSDSDSDTDSGDLKSNREIKLFWDAKKAELSYREMSGDLVSKTEFLETEKKRFSIIAGSLGNLNLRLSNELALSATQQSLVKSAIRDCVEKARDCIKSEIPDYCKIVNSALEKSSSDGENA